LIANRATGGLTAGVDVSQTMLEEAVKRNDSAIRAGRVELKQGDVASLPYPNEFFHKAMSIHSIYFWPHPVEGLREIRRVIKPGGTVAITVRKKNRAAYLRFTGDKLAEMLRSAGFQGAHYQDGPDASNPVLAALAVK